MCNILHIILPEMYPYVGDSLKGSIWEWSWVSTPLVGRWNLPGGFFWGFAVSIMHRTSEAHTFLTGTRGTLGSLLGSRLAHSHQTQCAILFNRIYCALRKQIFSPSNLYSAEQTSPPQIIVSPA